MLSTCGSQEGVVYNAIFGGEFPNANADLVKVVEATDEDGQANDAEDPEEVS